MIREAAENYVFPFLWMHGEDEAVLREYVNVIYTCNIRALCVESRPHPDFCGNGWWHDMDIIIDEAKKLGMQVWILDDSHFPTGYANGALEDADEKLCRQSLVYQKIEQKKQGEILELPLDEYKEAGPWTPNLNESYTMDMEKVRHFTDDRLLGIVAVKENGRDASDILTISLGKENTEKIHMVMPEGTWNIYVLHLTRNRGPHRNYINMMNKASCHKLIETVYEPHFYAHGHNPQYRHFGELMRYTNQVCGMLSGGRHITHVAVLYNAEAEWSGNYMDLEKPARILTEMQMDFDFIPADVLTDREAYKTHIGEHLTVNTQTYELLLIPYMQFIPQKVIDSLAELKEKGCKVCFIDAFPEGNCEGSAVVAFCLFFVVVYGKIYYISISDATMRKNWGLILRPQSLRQDSRASMTELLLIPVIVMTQGDSEEDEVA